MPSMGVVGSRLKKLVGSFDVLNFDLSLQRPAVVPSFDLKGVAGVLRSASNVVVMTGAGISTATGLPPTQYSPIWHGSQLSVFAE